MKSATVELVDNGYVIILREGYSMGPRTTVEKDPLDVFKALAEFFNWRVEWHGETASQPPGPSGN